MPELHDEDALIAAAERLLPEIGKCLHAAVANHPVAQGRTLPQIKVLFTLYHAGAATVGEVATAIGISMPAASETIDRLVDEGLVARRANPADRRQVIVELTPQARSLGDELHALRRAQIRNALDRLDPAERPYFLRSLQALVEALRTPPSELDLTDTAPSYAGHASSVSGT